MNPDLEYLTFKTELGQSEVFKRDYEQIFNDGNNNAVTSPLIADVAELLNKILMDCNELTGFQEEMLRRIFIAFNDIREKIDPHRLSTFKYAFNADEELLLYRDTDKGLTNIIINSEECIAYSYISKIGNVKILNFYDQQFQDYEAIAYRFFSN